MSVGGICNAALAREMLRPGAELLQIYGYVSRPRHCSAKSALPAARSVAG